MFSKKQLAVAAVVVSSVLCASTASAQTEAEQAAALYKEGIDLYFAEDYGLAITKFRAGYQLDPNPMFLYSISLCFYRLGNIPEARAHAERADAAGGLNERDAANNRARIAAFDVAITVHSMLPAQATRECVSDAQCTDGATCDVAAGLCLLPQPTQPTATTVRRLGPVGYAGIGAAAIGAGLLVGAGVTSLAVGRDETELARADDPTEAEALVTQIEKNKNLGKFFVLGGAGMTAVGLGLVVVDLIALPKRDDSVALTPMLLPGGGGLAWSVRF